MAITWPNSAGLLKLAAAYNFPTFRASLFVNNLTPGPDTVLTDFVTPVAVDLAPVTGWTFTVPALDGAGIPFVIAPEVLWTLTSAITIVRCFGVLIETTSGPSWWYADRFPVPIEMGFTGDFISYTPRVKHALRLP